VFRGPSPDIIPVNQPEAAASTSLRTGSPPQIVSLREAERELAAHLDTAAKDDEARVIADAVAQALDRITDSIDTLAYLLRPAERPAA